jgi:hypothetical protein
MLGEGSRALAPAQLGWATRPGPRPLHPPNPQVGNGCTDEAFDGNAFPLFAVGKSLIPVDLFTRLQQACQGNFWNASSGGWSVG